MSTPRKEDTKETSDPVLQNSGEVLQVVKEKFEEKKEPTMSDLFALINTKFDVMKTDSDARFDALENRMAVQEARVSPSRSPPRSRVPSQEIFKELKTAASVVEVTDRTSLLVDFVSSEDSASEDSAGVQVHLPLKTPVPGGPQFFARSLEADTRAGKAREYVPKQMFKVPSRSLRCRNRMRTVTQDRKRRIRRSRNS